jgi:hypothetical protein
MNVAVLASNQSWYAEDWNVTFATNFHYWTHPSPEIQPDLQPTPAPMPMSQVAQPVFELQVYSPIDGKQMVVYGHRGLGLSDYTAGILVFFSALLSSKMMRHHPAVY